MVVWNMKLWIRQKDGTVKALQAKTCQSLVSTQIALVHLKHLMVFGPICPDSMWSQWHQGRFFHLVVSYAVLLVFIQRGNILSIFWGGLKWLHVYSKAVASVQTYIQPLLLIDTENIVHMALKTLKRKSWQNTNCSDPTVTQIESVCGGWSSGWSWAFDWVARGFGSGHKGEVWPPVTKIREYFQCAKQVY